ncbi:glycosyltransferase family 2 protein [Fulvivirga lutea]|uniref:Glycosyltransferase family 2 protein n=1 Tax=Fulvivirga lutea TaxID=2810512 RepID=A0A975A1G2_9BACT|nr:glycosyltransferase family A protein [Fulvivirga lutea]QSE98409.1 glycosyltransferase family 2 protein [Fulvivirga lutea]
MEIHSKNELLNRLTKFEQLTNTEIDLIEEKTDKIKIQIEKAERILNSTIKINFDDKEAKKITRLLKYKLFNLGFTERALSDLEEKTKQDTSGNLRKLCAWELALWYANKYNQEAAKKCIYYLEINTDNGSNMHLSSQASVLAAESYALLNQIGKAKEILDRSLDVEENPDVYLGVASLQSSSKEKINWLNKAFRYNNNCEVTLTGDFQKPLYDQLITFSEAKKEGPLVTVIIPVYNSADTIGTALQSLLNQTWYNIEIIVADDCSTDQTLKVVSEFKDERVRVIKAEVNGGPYHVRNLALLEAKGEYITCNDADDWSHPEKIELQVLELQRNEGLVATMSSWARVTDDLIFFRRGNPGFFIQMNLSSLMIRKEVVFKSLGGWDQVRFGADSEFLHRIKTLFGNQSIIVLPNILSLARVSEGSLTDNKKFGYHGTPMGVRKEYAESYTYYHKRTRELLYDIRNTSRPFPVPNAMLNPKTKMLFFDMVVAFDFRIENSNKIEAIKQNIHEATSKGYSCGVVQISNYSSEERRVVNENIRSILNNDSVRMIVYGETVSTELLIIYDPFILTEKQEYIPKIKAGNLILKFNDLSYESDNKSYLNIDKCLNNIKDYFEKDAHWVPTNYMSRNSMYMIFPECLTRIELSKSNWKGVEPLLKEHESKILYQRNIARNYIIREQNIPKLKQSYYNSGLDAVPDTFVLYRIIGNDLYPRHKKGQSLENLRFILENEPELKDCQKRFIVNRIFDETIENEIVSLLKKHNVKYTIIKFEANEYLKVDFSIDCFSQPSYLLSEEFENSGVFAKYRAWLAPCSLKNAYLMNNNGARNLALEEGKKVAKWVLPWDGNCFITENAWEEFVNDVKRDPYFRHFIVPMARITNNRDLLKNDFRPSATEEPQIAFRHDTKDIFNEKFVYGRRPKVELFWRLGVPGTWDEWKQDDPWDPTRGSLSEEAYSFEFGGWVSRLYSGMGELEKKQNAGKRVLARNEAIFNSIAYVTSQCADAKKTDKVFLKSPLSSTSISKGSRIGNLIYKLKSTNIEHSRNLKDIMLSIIAFSLFDLPINGKNLISKTHEILSPESLKEFYRSQAQLKLGTNNMSTSLCFFLDSLRIIKDSQLCTSDELSELDKSLSEYFHWLLNSKECLILRISHEYLGVLFELQVLSLSAYLNNLESLYKSIIRLKCKYATAYLNNENVLVHSDLYIAWHLSNKIAKHWGCEIIGIDLISDTNYEMPSLEHELDFLKLII